MVQLTLAFIYGLVATSFAIPLDDHDHHRSHIERRTPGVIPSSVNCGGRTITRAQIEAALNEAYTPHQDNRGKTYPQYFGNRGTDRTGRPKSVLTHPTVVRAARSGNLQEQPVGVTGTWTGGDKQYVGATKFRVIFDQSVSSLAGSYMGMVYHPGREHGNFDECVEAGATTPSSTISSTRTATATATATATNNAAACAVQPGQGRKTTRSVLWSLVRRVTGSKAQQEKDKKKQKDCNRPGAGNKTPTTPKAPAPVKTPAPTKPKEDKKKEEDKKTEDKKKGGLGGLLGGSSSSGSKKKKGGKKGGKKLF